MPGFMNFGIQVNAISFALLRLVKLPFKLNFIGQATEARMRCGSCKQLQDFSTNKKENQKYMNRNSI